MGAGCPWVRPAVFGRATVLAGAALIGMLAVLPAAGQEQRHRTQPILRPWADAPTAVVRQLVFSDDAEGALWLYAAGDEKLVRRWRFEEQGGGRAALVGDAAPIAWPIYRDIRGVIYALDAQRDPQTGDQRLAIGGFGQQKSSQVNVLLASRPELAEVLIDSRHYQPANKVVSLDLDPKGALLAVGFVSSPEVLLWDVASPPGRDSRQAKTRLPTGLAEVGLLAFNPAGNLIAVAGTGQGKRRVQVWNVARGSKVSESLLAARAQGLTWRDDATWLVATAVQEQRNGAWVVPADSGLIQGRAGETKTSIVLSGRFVRQVAAVPGTNQFVLSVVDDVAAQRGRVVRWSPGGEPEPFKNGEFDDLVTALCVSPDGRLVAGTGTARIGGSQVPVYQVRVWRMGGELAAQAPHDENALAVGGPIGNVAVLPGKLNTESGKKAPECVAFAFGQFVKNRPHAPLAQKFRLLARAEGALSALKPEERNRVVATHEDRLFFDSRDEQGQLTGFYLAQVDAQGKARDPWLLPAPTLENFPYCYAVGNAPLDREGRKKLAVVAIGYVNGILVCDLAKVKEKQGSRAILRSYYGHSAPVTCVGFSDDGQWLVSGSMDGTISGWGLLGLTGTGPGRELGVRLDAGGRKVVTDPPFGSPGWEAGFRARQVVTGVEEDGRAVAAAQWKAKLENPIPGRELSVGIQHLTAVLKTHVSHDPLWTLYPYQDGEWLLWTPQGTFDCSPGAMRRAKWHVNLSGAVTAVEGAEVGALLFDVETFAPQYHVTFKRDQLSQVISTRRPDPPPAEFTLPLTLRNLAAIPASQAGQRLVTVDALLPSSQLAVTAFELLLNGRRLTALAPQAADGGGFRLTTTLEEALLRANYRNELVVIAAILQGQQTIRSRAMCPLELDGPPPGTRKLHFLGIGVTKLAGRQDLTELQQAANDVRRLAEVLRGARLDLELGSVATLSADAAGSEPTEQNIERALTDLAQAAGPNDLAIVLVAGHGLVDGRGEFRLIAQDSTDQGGLSATKISGLLSQLACRSLLMLDTCHSGQVGLASQLGGWPGLEVGPMVLAASGSNETSKESLSVGHGLFTAAILEALTGPRLVYRRSKDRPQQPRPVWDEDGDGKLSVAELCRYAELRTPQMIGELDLTDQNPRSLPSVTFTDADRFVFMPAAKQEDGQP